jgi:hypothetical protein
MRIWGNKERGIATLTAGRERARQARAAFNGPPVRPPEPGTLLKTIRVTDHIKGLSYTMTIHQGDRRNGIEPRLFGQRFMRAGCCGFDLLFRELRKRWSLRWLVLN